MTDENTSASDLCACDSSHAGQVWLPGRDGLTTGCKQVCIHASPTLEGVAGIRQRGVSAGELWVLQSSHAPRVTRLSTRIESTWSTSACAWVLWTGAFLDSPLPHRQFCHLRVAYWVAYWGPRLFPVPSDKKAAQSRSWQHLQAAHRCLLLPRIHPPHPASGRASSRTGDAGSEVGCFCFVLLE